jgi:hypothetical protein
MPRDTPNRPLYLRKLQAIARRHGGRCLADADVDLRRRLEFQCRAGHVWKAMPATIFAGRWCQWCTRADNLAKVQAIARERGGRCLSTEYSSARPVMRWRCAEGHEWSAPPGRIRDGTWCPACAGRRTIADMQALAAQHGGRCLSTSMAEGAYGGDLRWECAQGHQFAVRWLFVKNGQWCQECRKSQTAWYRARARAEELGGRCLVDGPCGPMTPVPWRCAQGHEFSTTAYRVTLGAWCSRCSGRRLGIEDMQEMAAERGGRCLSREYVDLHTELRWECAEGHRWRATPMKVRFAKAWCPRCPYACGRKPRAEQTDGETWWRTALARAEESGGALVEGRERTAWKSVRWRCAAGHEWTSSACSVAKGNWCPNCSGRRLTLEHMHATAAEQGGRCLSKKFVDVHTKLRWECAEGHRWWAEPAAVRHHGTWCPRCATSRNAAHVRSAAGARG